MMRKEEVGHFLKTYTKTEEEARKGVFDAPEALQEYRRVLENPYEGASSKTYLFEDNLFLKADEIIGIHRQDRFVPVHRHRHNYIELNYVWSGVCIQEINGEKIVCRQGDICILNTQAVHQVETAGDNDIFINLLMRKEFFETAFFSRMIKQGILTQFLAKSVLQKHNKNQYLVFETHKNERIAEVMLELVREYYGNALGREEAMKSYIIILFTEILRTFQQYGEQEPDKREEYSRIYEVLEYIEKNYEACTLPILAETFGYHPQYLTTLLKEKTGKSYVEHLQEQRLNKAKFMLTYTDMKISEIILACGYKNENFFYQKFKSNTNETPAHYRNNFYKSNNQSVIREDTLLQ